MAFRQLACYLCLPRAVDNLIIELREIVVRCFEIGIGKIKICSVHVGRLASFATKLALHVERNLTLLVIHLYGTLPDRLDQ